ncbi:carbonic anhydrase family protein [Pleomorphovibrio marinus]|uniref:carbonic anhydrase family protein n=1 Tax=Pleomorphovibrio marinus TaxID=2164132 RepID=UPI002937077D|nr:carbonic anhydrase family protein [Pleomorphovibrio marinus]
MMRAINKEVQDKITPKEALKMLKEGNIRFVKNQKAERDLLQMVKETAEGQWPFAVVLSCIDSRTSSELIFDQGIGDIFNARVAGNIVNEDILGSIEYAVKYARSKIVVVLGHTKCGAVTSACQGVEDGNITKLLEKIKPAISKEKTEKSDRSGGNPEFVEKVSKLNVQHAIDEIRNKSTIISEIEKNGGVLVIGGMYNVGTGKVEFYDGLETESQA